MNPISDYLKDVFGKFLASGQPRFSKIQLKRAVLLDIIDFANANHPKEFVAVLEGNVIDGTLVIDGLLYQPFHSSKGAAVMRQDLPLTTNAIGTVHSHPTPNSSPSAQDLRLFNRGGIVHLIIGYPFTEQAIACYDLNGKPLQLEIE
jgi:proteasome lid subunit RPN8/RPN11